MVSQVVAQGIQHRHSLDHRSVLIQQLAAGVAGVIQRIAGVGAVSSHSGVLGLVCVRANNRHTALDQLNINIVQVPIKKIALFVAHGHCIVAGLHLVRDIKGQGYHHAVAGVSLSTVPDRCHGVSRQITGGREMQGRKRITPLNALEGEAFRVGECKSHIGYTGIFLQGHLNGDLSGPHGDGFLFHRQSSANTVLRHGRSYDQLQQKRCEHKDG